MSLRIAIIMPEEPLYLPRVVQRVAEVRRQDIVALVILSPVPPKSSWLKNVRKHLALFGWWDFFRQGTRFAAVKVANALPRSPNGRLFSVAKVAERYALPVMRTRNINSAEFLADLRSRAPDVVVSIGAPQIFRKEILALPRLGCINVHSALLPKYRGVMPSFWVLANNETETGVTVHFMDEKLDNGDILVQRRVAIAPEDSQHTLLLKTKAAAAEALLEALTALENGTAQPQPNDASQATYYSFPGPDDVRRFRAAGRRFY